MNPILDVGEKMKKNLSQTVFNGEKIPFDHILCPVMIFDDETYADRLGSLTAQPILFSILNFPLVIRKQCLAWNILGYVPSYPKTLQKRSKDKQTKLYNTLYLK